MSNDFTNVFIFSILDPVACDLDRKSIILDKWEVEFGLYMVAGIFTASGRTCYQVKVRQRKTNLKIGRSPGAPGSPGAPSSPSTHLVHSPVKKSNRWPCQARNAQDHLREFHIWFDFTVVMMNMKPNQKNSSPDEHTIVELELLFHNWKTNCSFVSLTEWFRDPWIYDDRDKILV